MKAILGITDEQTTCDRCGKTHLRNTVIIHDDEFPGVELGRYGSTCAGKELGIKGVLGLARRIEEVRSYWFWHYVKQAKQLKAAGKYEEMMGRFGPVQEAKNRIVHPHEKAAYDTIFTC